MSENRDEVKWVMDLFPGYRSYLDIYDQYGLLRPRSVYGHCVWLDDDDRRRMRDAGAVAAHCPTSNQFLGSGLFDFAAAKDFGMPVALATDVGGGSSFSMLLTMNEAHKVARLSGHYLTARRMFWQATQGAAKHLGLTGRIGTLEPGRRGRLHRPGSQGHPAAGAPQRPGRIAGGTAVRPGDAGR